MIRTREQIEAELEKEIEDHRHDFDEFWEYIENISPEERLRHIDEMLEKGEANWQKTKAEWKEDFKNGTFKIISIDSPEGPLEFLKREGIIE